MSTAAVLPGQYASICSPGLIPGAVELRPQSRDLLTSLLAPLKGEEVLERMLTTFFVGIHHPSTRDLPSPAQAAAVGALFHFVHFSPGEG